MGGQGEEKPPLVPEAAPDRAGAAPRLITGVVGGLTVALTAGAFWLSYAHLHQVAAGHGLAGDQIRSWAWPGTVDLFIAIGELLTLRASLAHRVDWWAIGLAVIGSGGSIVLNVAGVGPGASVLDYVVAAVPPVAALLAIGALMRQVHDFLSARAPAGSLLVLGNEHERQEEDAVPGVDTSTLGPVTLDERPEASTSNEREQESPPPVLVHDEHRRASTPPPPLVLAPERARATSTGHEHSRTAAPAARPRAANLAQLARELLGRGASNEQAAARIIEQLPGAKPDSVRAAVRRERRALAGT